MLSMPRSSANATPPATSQMASHTRDSSGPALMKKTNTPAMASAALHPSIKRGKLIGKAASARVE